MWSSESLGLGFSGISGFHIEVLVDEGLDLVLVAQVDFGQESFQQPSQLTHVHVFEKYHANHSQANVQRDRPKLGVF